MNRLQERDFRVINDDKCSNFQKFISKDDDFIIHSRNLETSIIEIYKTTNSVPPPIMGSLLYFRENSLKISNDSIKEHK